jgi:hypothetical protein
VDEGDRIVDEIEEFLTASRSESSAVTEPGERKRFR